jgi:hypothetical protein
VYLAIVVGHALERFAAACAEVANDNGLCHGQPNEQGLRTPQVSTPTFEPAACDVDWQAIPADLADAVLSLPVRIDEANGRIAAIDEYDYDPPDFIEYFETRRRLYAELGLYALRTATALREHSHLPCRLDRGWNAEAALAEAKAITEEQMRQRQERAQHAPPIPLTINGEAPAG